MSPRVAAESTTGQAFRGLIWLLTGSGAQALVRLATTLLLARLIAPEAFGLVAAALTVVELAEVVTQMGVGPTLVQMREVESEHLEVGLSLSLLLGIAFGLGTCLLAPVAADFFEMPDLTGILQLLSLLFPLRSMSVVSISLQRRNLAFRQLALAQLVSYTASYAGLAVVLALLGWGAWALVAAQLCDALLRSAIALWQSPPRLRLGANVRVARQLVSSGAGFTLAQIFSIIALKGDNVVVGRWLGSAALGFYTRAYGLMTLPVDLISSILQRVLFPAMSRLQADKVRLAKAYERGISLLALALMPASVLLCVLSEEIVALLLGARWMEVSEPLRLLAWGVYFRGSYKLSGTIADAVGQAHRNAVIQLVYALLIVASAWVGRHWGLTGVALGVAVVLFIEFLLLSRMALDILSLRWPAFLALHLRGLCAALLTLAVSFPITWLSRSLGLPALLTCTLAAGGCAVLSAALLTLAPRVLLGPAEIWFTRVLRDQLGERSAWAERALSGLLLRAERAKHDKSRVSPVSLGGSDPS